MPHHPIGRGLHHLCRVGVFREHSMRCGNDTLSSCNYEFKEYWLAREKATFCSTSYYLYMEPVSNEKDLLFVENQANGNWYM